MKKLAAELLLEIQNIVGKHVTYCRAGGGAGSIILMDLEESMFTFWINCAWRLHCQGKILTGSNESTRAVTGKIARNVRKLEGKIIQEVSLSPYYDVHIKFIDGYELFIFCDITPGYPSDTMSNWSFSIPPKDISYDITKRIRIEMSTYY